ncbi:GGDEF domain-containing protein [Vibrio ostreicida]|uniref:GGDEF domain-containing protein n=1 Tax=Vibrio ostreicida TaxID=526588 RepID=A0ABT8BZ76_9VIBR|nr:GGDEF domain-containing protein [Vibrio ostreicida]MDN3612465.1 GGDEF domain-containing protein [Vibrio ostreicida]NPD10174.1 GGDEF domain-containing protein [Vibrio ostreicida]
MARFVGQQLEKMADLRSARNNTVLLLCTIVSVAVLIYLGFMHLVENNVVVGGINLASAMLLLANVGFLKLRPSSASHADLIVSGILLFQGTVILVYGDGSPERLLWLYPIIVAVVFLCEFRTGSILSSAFYLLTVVFCLSFDSVSPAVQWSENTFLLSFLVLLFLCNTSSYFYSKAVNYIKSLHQEGIEELAYRDHLTGLANRWSFENWALEKLAQEQQATTLTAMVFLDIDNFKVINDTYGHDIGDRVLQHFAQRLQNNIRSKDRKTDRHDYSIARFAGDEFVLLLYGVQSQQDLDRILERICHLFEGSDQSTERINQLTLSVGVALYPDDADSLPELTRCADKAMYSAKHRGKNQYRYYQRERANHQSEDSDNITNIKKI